jgi:hypothetical protein
MYVQQYVRDAAVRRLDDSFLEFSLTIYVQNGGFLGSFLTIRTYVDWNPLILVCGSRCAIGA